MGYDRLVIHPSNPWKAIFDRALAISIMYTVIAAPILVVFELDGILAVSVIVEVLFVLDIVLQFFHGYFDLGSSRLPVLDLRTVARGYALTPTAFAADLLSLLSNISWASSKTPYGEWRFLTILRLFRLLRLRKRWRGLGVRHRRIKLVEPLAGWLLAAHWFGSEPTAHCSPDLSARGAPCATLTLAGPCAAAGSAASSS